MISVTFTKEKTRRICLTIGDLRTTGHVFHMSMKEARKLHKALGRRVKPKVDSKCTCERNEKDVVIYVRGCILHDKRKRSR